MNLLDQSQFRNLTQEEHQLLERVGSKILLLQKIGGGAHGNLTDKTLTGETDLQKMYHETTLSRFLEEEEVSVGDIAVFPVRPLFDDNLPMESTDLKESMEGLKNNSESLIHTIRSILAEDVFPEKKEAVEAMVKRAVFLGDQVDILSNEISILAKKLELKEQGVELTPLKKKIKDVENVYLNLRHEVYNVINKDILPEGRVVHSSQAAPSILSHNQGEAQIEEISEENSQENSFRMNPECDFADQEPLMSGDADKGSFPKQEDTERSLILDKIHRFFKNGSSRKVVSFLPSGFSDPTAYLASPHAISVYRDRQGKYTINDINFRIAFSDPDLLKALDYLLSPSFYPECYRTGHLIVADLAVGPEMEAQEASWNFEAQKLSEFVQNDIIPFELVALRDAQNPEKIQGRVYKLNQEQCIVMVGEDPVRYLMPIQKIGICFEETPDRMIAEIDTDSSKIKDQLHQSFPLFDSQEYTIDRTLFPKGVVFFADPVVRVGLDRYLEIKRGERSEPLLTKLILGMMASYFDMEDDVLRQIFQHPSENAQATFKTKDLQRQISQEIPLLVEYERFYERMVEYLKDKDDKQKGYWDMQHHVIFGCLMTDFEMNPAGEDSKGRETFNEIHDSLAASMTEEQLQRAETKVRKFEDEETKDHS